MVAFPNCKINLGLNVIERRRDGYHNIETVFYPVLWQDALEVIENNNSKLPFLLSESGNNINTQTENNLIYKAWQLIIKEKKMPNIKVHLHKSIPTGAGLGGGSADAAFFINCVNTKFNFNFSQNDKLNIASKIGSDCAFFINNKAVFAKGKGNEFDEITLDLSRFYILLVNTNIHCDTKEAYNSLIPKKPIYDLRHSIKNKPIELWKKYLTNDFEEIIFKKYPSIKELKDLLYLNNAIYASMSGSGSSVFGIFNEEPHITFPNSYKLFLQNPNTIYE
jgi:4-diphosphocytidyl-2-C-methyl-D-erythritol kinase